MGMGFMQTGIKLAVIYYRLFLRECKAEKILHLINVHKIGAPQLREAPQAVDFFDSLARNARISCSRGTYVPTNESSEPCLKGINPFRHLCIAATSCDRPLGGFCYKQKC